MTIRIDPPINIRFGRYRFGLGGHCLTTGIDIRGGSFWIATRWLILARGYF